MLNIIPISINIRYYNKLIIIMKQYKVIKEFGCANKGDIFSEENDVFVLDVELNCDDFYSSKYMSIAPSVMDTLASAGYVIELTNSEKAEEPSKADLAISKIEKLKDIVISLKDQYEEDYQALMAEYNEGNVPACVKVEADTVYFNMNKILNKVLEIVNE